MSDIENGGGQGGQVFDFDLLLMDIPGVDVGALMMWDIQEMISDSERTAMTNVMDSLRKSGCHDAAIRVRDGLVYLRFLRRSLSLEEAIQTAIQNVKDADLGVDIVGIAF